MRRTKKDNELTPQKLGIRRAPHKIRTVQTMPKYGFKNTTVQTKTVTLARTCLDNDDFGSK